MRERHARAVPLPDDVGEGGHLVPLPGHERRVDQGAVARDHDGVRRHGSEVPVQGGRPVHRPRVRAERRVGGLLDEVAEEDHAGVRDPDPDVAVGMPAPGVGEVHHAVTEVEAGRRREGDVRSAGHGGEQVAHVLGRVARVGARVGVRAEAGLEPLGVGIEGLAHPLVGVDGGLAEGAVAERVVVVHVGVDHDGHGNRQAPGGRGRRRPRGPGPRSHACRRRALARCPRPARR